MFVITMANTFAIGDRAAVRIDGEPTTLLWRDADILVIGETDARLILKQRSVRTYRTLPVAMR
jgi:hypothetical protein